MYTNRPGVKDNQGHRGGPRQADRRLGPRAVDRPRLRRGDVLQRRHRSRPQPTCAKGIQPHLQKKGTKPTRTTGAPSPPGRGAFIASSITWSTDKDIDSEKIIVVGHSRLGKTALLAAAFDERIALAIPHQAGCGGTAPSRSNDPKAESVKRINTSFPHWFDGDFKEFNDQPDRLPFDQHCLVALVAPRPVLFMPTRSRIQWANPTGQFEVLKAADPVYRLLGAGGLAAKEMPEVGKLIDSTLGYYIRPGKHSMTTATTGRCSSISRTSTSANRGQNDIVPAPSARMLAFRETQAFALGAGGYLWYGSLSRAIMFCLYASTPGWP